MNDERAGIMTMGIGQVSRRFQVKVNMAKLFVKLCLISTIARNFGTGVIITRHPSQTGTAFHSTLQVIINNSSGRSSAQ